MDWRDAEEYARGAFLAAIVYLAACLALYEYAKRCKRKGGGGEIADENVRRLFGRVLLVIAHPDDECMFFGPTILELRRRGATVHLLCLSMGDRRKVGNVRLGELYESCAALGIDARHVTVYRDALLPDEHVHWPSERVARIVSHHVEALSADALVTFDKMGVSQHPNHASVFYGVARLCVERRFPKDCSIFVLDSVNKLRKYWGYVDLPLSFLLSSHRFIVCATDKKIVKGAMRKHKSQMIWFRHLYLIFSRYISINTLRLLTLPDLELDLELDD